MRVIGAMARAFVLCGLILASQASAAGQIYFGGSGGKTDIGGGITSGLITSGTVDHKDKGFKFFGGYQFNEYIALEAAYVDLGKVKYSGDFLGAPVTGGEVKVTGYNFSIVISVPVSTAISIFGKAGQFSSESKAEDVTGGAPFSQTIRKTSDSAGLGMSYNITRNLSARLEYERFRIKVNDTIAFFVNGGVAFRF
jgi:OOP family OmpA-OmpF porin